MNIAFIRGQYLNNYELQSYYPLLKNPEFEITGFGSLKPMHETKIPVKHFPSPVDLPNFPSKLPVLNRLFIDAMYLYGMEKELKNFDIAHVRETYFHFSHQAIEAKKRGLIKKVLVTCSETIVNNHETIWGRKRFKQNVIANADYFHCLTLKAKETLVAEGVIPEKIEVIPYGVDRQFFKPTQRKANGRLTILFVGRMEEQKGVVELLEAWKKIKKNNKNVELIAVGSGPLEHLFLEQGITPKKYPYSKMPEIMKDADVLVLPSKPTSFWEEYFGMVLIEAMACGLPIVTTTCGAIPEVIGNAGLLAQPGSAKSLYTELKSIIENESLRNKLREMGLQRVNIHFETEKQAAKLGRLYQKVLGL